MCKKFLSVVLVLALGSVVLAGTVQWADANNSAPVGAWETVSNWSWTLPDSGLPTLNDTVRAFRADGQGANITVTSTDGTAKAGKLQFKHSASSIVHLSISGYLENSGSVEMTTSKTYVTIQTGGRWDSCTIQSGSAFYLGGGTNADENVNVYGTLNVAANLNIGGTAGGNAFLNIYNSGVVNADSYTINTAANRKINLYGSGRMYVKGNVVTQAQADIDDERITCDISKPLAVYDEGTNKTMIYNIPEPVTIALLGLGGLLFRRKH